MAKKCL